MGIDTKAILRKGTTIEQIEKALCDKYVEVKVGKLKRDDVYINFKDGADERTLYTSFSNYCEKEYGIAGVWVSLGKWGNSVEIARYLCETFGGYLDENDCDDEGFYPINFDLYSQGSEFTKLDEFKFKLIGKIGYDKLNTVMSLIKEYSDIFKV